MVFLRAYLKAYGAFKKGKRLTAYTLSFMEAHTGHVVVLLYHIILTYVSHNYDLLTRDLLTHNY